MNYQHWWIIVISKLILCFLDLFDKSVFDFAGLESIVFFFLATILIMLMFNFQFWVRIKLGSWYYLRCCTSLPFSIFFNVFLSKSKLQYFFIWLPPQIWYCIISILLHILSSLARSQVNTLIVKFRFLPRKTLFNLRYFIDIVLLIDNVSNTDGPILW